MAKTSTVYRCTNCNTPSSRWAGRCGRCGEFGTVNEEAPAAVAVGLKSSGESRTPRVAARRIADIDPTGSVTRLSTGIGEFDRVLGGGMVPGQAVLLAGSPGVGKSTLLLHTAQEFAQRHGPVVYASGEESVEQIAVRAKRLGVDAHHLLLTDDPDVQSILGHIQDHTPALVIADSVQTLASTDVDGRAGGVAQVMEVATLLTRSCKARGIVLVLVGQVTKTNDVAGPQTLSHLTDAVLMFEGDPHSSLRLLRAEKNRYGPTPSIGAFEQTDTGLAEVPDPSALFRSTRDTPVPGSCVTVTVEGQRSLLTEVQALVASTAAANPRRSVSGLDNARTIMLIAVTERATGTRLGDKDVFAATVGGIKLSDPATDLAVALAVASAATNTVIPPDVCAIGEVTLSGDLRPAPMLSQRIDEAERMGYTRILAPTGTRQRVATDNRTATLMECPTLTRALQILQPAPAEN